MLRIADLQSNDKAFFSMSRKLCKSCLQRNPHDATLSLFRLKEIKMKVQQVVTKLLNLLQVKFDMGPRSVSQDICSNFWTINQTICTLNKINIFLTENFNLIEFLNPYLLLICSIFCNVIRYRNETDLIGVCNFEGKD